MALMLNWSFLLCYSWQRLKRTNSWFFFFRRRLWSRAPNLNRRRSLRLLVMRCQSPRQCNGINDPEVGVISRLCTDFIIDLCEINECSWNCMALHGCPHWTNLACSWGKNPFCTVQLISERLRCLFAALCHKIADDILHVIHVVLVYLKKSIFFNL